jgi:hypothetical protein
MVSSDGVFCVDAAWLSGDSRRVSLPQQPEPPLGRAVIFPSGVAALKQLNVISLSGVILSLLLLHRFKVKVIPLILLGIGFGSIRYFLGF